MNIFKHIDIITSKIILMLCNVGNMNDRNIVIDSRTTVQLNFLSVAQAQRIDLLTNRDSQQRSNTTVEKRLKEMHLMVFCSFSVVTFCRLTLVIL